jgi:PAS domain S-box-containing protein
MFSMHQRRISPLAVTATVLAIGCFCIAGSSLQGALSNEAGTVLGAGLGLLSLLVLTLVLRQGNTGVQPAAEQEDAALRQSEHWFRQLADTLPQMVWVTQPDGYHEYYNRRWYEFTGVPLGSTDGEGWNGMFHPEDQEKAWAAWRHSLATGAPYEIEYRLKHHSGNYRWTLGRALPIRNSQDEIERWFGTCTDIDALKRLTSEREQLLESEREARAQAERASHLKDEFLATVSHELRTPLNAILGWAQVLRHDQIKTDTLKKGLSVIERNAISQSRLIEDILDMSRIITGKIRLDVQEVDLHDMIADTVETVRPAAEAKEIFIQTVLDPRAGQVRGDPNRLQQVAWNLLSNAVKFTPKGGKIQVSLERVSSHIEMTVADTGQGIEPEFLPFAFDRFRQFDGSTTREHSGLGLGLSLVKQLIDLHGGQVSVSSPGRDQGATFVVKLPLSIIHGADEPEQIHPAMSVEDKDPRVLSEQLDLHQVKVLAVDDDPDSLALLRRVLEERGARVITASSAAEALELLEVERPDVLLSDIGMPGMDGYELIRRVRSLAPEAGGRVPAAALTAFARPEDRTRALLAGYQMHATKPIRPAELMALVASLAGLTGPNRVTGLRS